MKITKVLFVFLFCLAIPVLAMNVPEKKTKNINQKIKTISSLKQLCKQPLVTRWEKNQALREQEVAELSEYVLQNDLSFFLGSTLLQLHHTTKQKVKSMLYSRIPVHPNTLANHAYSINSITFGPDDKLLANSVTDKTIRLWDVNSGKDLFKLEGHTDPVLSVAFSPDGKQLASGATNKTIRLWDIKSKQVSTLEGHTGWIYSLAFSSNSKQLTSGSSDKTIRLWDIKSKQASTLEGHTGPVWSVAFSPDGKLLASGSEDETIRLWDITSGKELSKLEGHTGLVRAVTFSPDGKILASSSVDETIRLWDITSGKELSKLEGHTGPVWSVAFSPDGKILASSSVDKIKLWDLKLNAALYILDNEVSLQDATAAVQWAKEDDDSEIPIKQLRDLLKKE